MELKRKQDNVLYPQITQQPYSAQRHFTENRKQKLIKIITTIVACITAVEGFLFLFPAFAYADTIDVKIVAKEDDNGKLSIETSDMEPLNMKITSPGDSCSFYFTIDNTSTEILCFSIERIENTLSENELYNELEARIVANNETVYSGLCQDINDSGKILLYPKESAGYEVDISLPNNLENTYQGKLTKINMVFNANPNTLLCDSNNYGESVNKNTENSDSSNCTKENNCAENKDSSMKKVDKIEISMAASNEQSVKIEKTYDSTTEKKSITKFRETIFAVFIIPLIILMIPFRKIDKKKGQN